MLVQINTTGCDGSDLFWPWFMWLFGAFIVGLLLGWVLKQLFEGDATSKTHIRKINHLEAELIACRNEKSAITASASALAAAPLTDDSVKDDLTIVEGIGPKIKVLLNADGLWSFTQLANASSTRLHTILNNAGPRYKMHNPKTWTTQAQLAADGRWEELQKWQNELKGGR